MFNKRSVIGLFTDEDSVADALDKVSESGFSSAEYEILTGTPYPDGTFGDEEPKHKLYRFPIIGAMCGFIVGLLLTAGNQIAFPLITGGKPLLSIPPMLIIMYEGTMLGAILFTVFGIILNQDYLGFSWVRMIQKSLKDILEYVLPQLQKKCPLLKRY